MLTQEKKRTEFERIREFLAQAEIAAEVADKGRLFDDTVLLVSLPTAEEFPEDHELTEEELHLAVGYLVDLDGEEERLSRYLMFYSQIEVDLAELTKAEVLSMLNELNRRVRLGCFFLGPVDGQETEGVQYRMMVSGVPEEPFDEGLVADAILEMGTGYDVALGALSKANDEKKRGQENG